jgi:hypothetical protein
MRGCDWQGKIRGELVRESAVAQELERHPHLHKILLGRGGRQKVSLLVCAIA